MKIIKANIKDNTTQYNIKLLKIEIKSVYNAIKLKAYANKIEKPLTKS